MSEQGAGESQRPTRHTRFVRAGALYLLVVAVVGIATGSRPNNLVIWLFSALIAALLVSGLISGLMMLPIRALRLEPRRGRVGEPLLIRYEVSNRSRFMPAFDISVSERVDATRLEPVGSAWILHAGPRDTVHAEAVFRPQRRGLVTLERFEVTSTFPFGLIRKILRFRQPAQILIHPEVVELRPDLLSSVASGSFGGQRLSGQAGGSDDFFGVREYKPGDSVRHIAWKRLAGTGRLATVERGRAVPPRIRVLLDLRRPTEALRTAPEEDARALEERAIVLAASMVALADRLGYEYGLSIAGISIPAVGLRRGHFHLEKIMSLLAAIDLDSPRLAGNGLAASDERATLLSIHPDRTDTAVAPKSAWHFTARQLDSLRGKAGAP
jgi:uncharacterized protein (DUF58 family)